MSGGGSALSWRGLQRDGRHSMYQADSFDPLATRDAVCQGLKRVFFSLVQVVRRRRVGVHVGPVAAPCTAAEVCPFEDTQAQWKELSAVAQVRRDVSPGTPTRLRETENGV